MNQFANMMIPGPAGALEYAFARTSSDGYIIGVAVVYGEQAREAHIGMFPGDIPCDPEVTPQGWHYRYGRFERKKAMNIVVRGMNILGLPAPCYLVAAGNEYYVEPGVSEVELDFEAPGKYEVRVTMNPEYFDEVITIEKDD